MFLSHGFLLVLALPLAQALTDGFLNIRKHKPQSRSAVGILTSRFHERCSPEEADRKAWDEYKAFHKACRSDPACARTAITWVCRTEDSRAGLGDQVRGLATTFYLAMANKRPFFVSWQRNGNDIAQLLGLNGLDVTPPSDDFITGCEKVDLQDGGGGLISFAGALEKTQQVGSKAPCQAWHTNVQPGDLFRMEELKKFIPSEMEHIQPRYAVGCAMSFIFQQPALTPLDKANLMQLPENYAAIHLRVGDDELGKSLGNWKDNVEASLACAKSQGFHNVLFLAGSEQAKAEAVQLAKGSDLNVFESLSTAHHSGEQGKSKSLDWLRKAYWSEWVALLHADALILGSRFSGFSGTAASMSFLPEDRYFDRNCQPYHDPLF